MTDVMHVFSLIATGIIWVLFLYQLMLAVTGYFFYRKSVNQRESLLEFQGELPPVTIMVPAHNEAKVIEATVRRLLDLDYPADRLEVMVINDASTDETGEIIDRLAAEDKRVRAYHRGPIEGGRGKGAALNAAYKLCKNEYIIIYDADNHPEPQAVKLLVLQMLQDTSLAGAVGKFRTGNRRKNILTRFINIEGLGYQNIYQAGRWLLFRLAALTGTNYLIRRSVLEAVDGWDEESLTEDQELSVRLCQAGYTVAYTPHSVSWEQEPETFSVWLRQRTRWARGTMYTLSKMVRSFRTSRQRVRFFEYFFVLCIPFMVLFALIVSQTCVVMSMCNMQVTGLVGPLKDWWIYALIISSCEFFLALSYDDEDNLPNLGLCLLGFTYSQVSLLPYIRAFYLEVIICEKRVWDKTERFDTAIEAPTLSTMVTPAPVAEKQGP